MPLSPGARLGPYEILSAIGAGGMGEVYKARDTRLDRAVALKVIQSAVAGVPEMRERFEREARAISALDHPHICILYDVCREADVSFLVMQYLEGETHPRQSTLNSQFSMDDRGERFLLFGPPETTAEPKPPPITVILNFAQSVSRKGS